MWKFEDDPEITRCRSGQKGDETAKPIKCCEYRRILQEPSSSARLIEFCENRQVLQDPSSLVTTKLKIALQVCSEVMPQKA